VLDARQSGGQCYMSTTSFSIIGLYIIEV